MLLREVNEEVHLTMRKLNWKSIEISINAVLGYRGTVGLDVRSDRLSFEYNNKRISLNRRVLFICLGNYVYCKISF